MLTLNEINELIKKNKMLVERIYNKQGKHVGYFIGRKFDGHISK